MVLHVDYESVSSHLYPVLDKTLGHVAPDIWIVLFIQSVDVAIRSRWSRERLTVTVASMAFHAARRSGSSSYSTQIIFHSITVSRVARFPLDGICLANTSIPHYLALKLDDPG